MQYTLSSIIRDSSVYDLLDKYHENCLKNVY